MPIDNKIISTPEISAAAQQNAQSFGYCEILGRRSKQEDALTWQQVNEINNLSPQEIGFRLWTTYQILDKQVTDKGATAGTTASTTVYDGKGNIVTATLADAVAFAVVYDAEGKVLGVTRLNSITHKPNNPEEKTRIKNAEGDVWVWAMYVYNNKGDAINVSRAIGDSDFKPYLVAEARIDITSKNEILHMLNIEDAKVGKIQIITTCDGFTDATKEETKEAHETLLRKALDAMAEKNPDEKTIAEHLAKYAFDKGSFDNISVAVQTLTTTPVLMGIYDGHGGTSASHYVAQHIGDTFQQQCKLRQDEYEKQELSAYRRLEVYNEHHSDAPLLVAPVAPLPPAEISLVNTSAALQDYKPKNGGPITAAIKIYHDRTWGELNQTDKPKFLCSDTEKLRKLTDVMVALQNLNNKLQDYPNTPESKEIIQAFQYVGLIPLHQVINHLDKQLETPIPNNIASSVICAILGGLIGAIIGMAIGAAITSWGCGFGAFAGAFIGLKGGVAAGMALGATGGFIAGAQVPHLFFSHKIQKEPTEVGKAFDEVKQAMDQPVAGK